LSGWAVERGRLARFSVAGIAGFVVDAAILQIAIAAAGLGPIEARALSFPIAVLTTFALNWLWSFSGPRRPLQKALPQYLAVQGAGVAVNIAAYALMVRLLPVPLGHPIAALATASGLAMTLNYLGARNLAFATQAVPRGPQSPTRTAGFLVVVIVGISTVGIALFLLLSFLSLDRGVDEMRQRIAAAYVGGDLGSRDYRFGNTVIGVHQFNDCLILGMALDQRGSKRQLAVSPLLATFPETGLRVEPCRSLRKLASGEAPQATELYYHRYLHGQTVLVRYLLPRLGLRWLRLVFAGALSLAIMGVVALSMYRLARGENLWSHLLLLSLGLSLARWFGLETFSQSLGHAPADLVIAVFALSICAMARRGVTLKQLVLVSALFGFATVLMELLTGGLPLGLALVIGASPFLLRDPSDARAIVHATLLAAAAFGGAAGVTLLLKLGVAAAVFGTEVLSDFALHLAHRTSGAADVGALTWLQRLTAGLSALSGGMRFLSAAALIVSVCGGVWGLLTIRRCLPDRLLWTKCLILGFSNLVLLLWLIVFWQHTIEHAWFMDRMLVWTIASGAALFAFGLVAAGSTGQKFTGQPR